MKVVVFAPEFPPRVGGMERYAFELVKNLARNNEVSVIVRKDYDNFDYRNIGLSNVKVIPIITFDFDEDVDNVITYVKENNIDLVHINNAGFSPAIPKIKSGLNVPVIATVHGKDFLKPFVYGKS